VASCLIVSKEKWDKSIKVQAKNTLFIKKLSTNTYGSAELRKRTVGSPKDSDKGKKAATPRKVDAFVGKSYCYMKFVCFTFNLNL
jgi:hypothetical protein